MSSWRLKNLMTDLNVTEYFKVNIEVIFESESN